MAVTIKDIARRLNLSVSTVSYALNEGPKPVSKEVHRRVKRMALELGYRPNRIAKSLVTRRTHTIGVIPVDVEIDILMTPCVHMSLNGIVNAAERLRQDVLLFTAHDRNLPSEVVADILDGRVDGVVFIAPRPDSPALRNICQSALPYSIIAADDQHGPCYTVDNESGVRLALEHLYEMGHRRIAHVTGNMAQADAALRLSAYQQFMTEKGLPVEACSVFKGDYWRGSGFQAGLAFADLDRRPTAVFCANDEMAFGLIEAFQAKGIRTPEDVSVVGFDDAPAGNYFSPPLTTVRQPLQAMASEALEAVVQQIETGEAAPGKIYKPELVTRGSSAIIPM
ncbi:MAG TPA: LacI family DNA-binding transcriptional regulator [Fimbriimonas sp.]|nr:LacI family DNA-binding transcriptional regulator [Fimbriimonas sp.]